MSTIHTILRNRLYTGWFEWNGKLIQGRHEALIPVELWERVQGVLDGRFAKKAKRGKHDFAFSGLIACAQCGCAVVGEIKKQRYVYYHCTGYADKCQGNPASCRRKREIFAWKARFSSPEIFAAKRCEIRASTFSIEVLWPRSNCTLSGIHKGALRIPLGAPSRSAFRQFCSAVEEANSGTSYGPGRMRHVASCQKRTSVLNALQRAFQCRPQ